MTLRTQSLWEALGHSACFFVESSGQGMEPWTYSWLPLRRLVVTVPCCPGMLTSLASFTSDYSSLSLWPYSDHLTHADIQNFPQAHPHAPLRSCHPWIHPESIYRVPVGYQQLQQTLWDSQQWRWSHFRGLSHWATCYLRVSCRPSDSSPHGLTAYHSVSRKSAVRPDAVPLTYPSA